MQAVEMTKKVALEISVEKPECPGKYDQLNYTIFFARLSQNSKLAKLFFLANI